MNYDGMGGLNQWQAQALARVVRGRYVYDLGAGFLYYANRLIELGADHVHAVDKIYKNRYENCYNDNRPWWKCAPKGVSIDYRNFAEFHAEGPQTLDVAFVAWPHNTYAGTIGLELICLKAKTVIYLGNNFNGTMCGSQLFWQYLRARPVIAHAPAKCNSLIVFGEKHGSSFWQRMLDDPHMPAEERAAHRTHAGDGWISTPEYFT